MATSLIIIRDITHWVFIKETCGKQSCKLKTETHILGNYPNVPVLLNVNFPNLYLPKFHHIKIIFLIFAVFKEVWPVASSPLSSLVISQQDFRNV